MKPLQITAFEREGGRGARNGLQYVDIFWSDLFYLLIVEQKVIAAPDHNDAHTRQDSSG
jgi:hypothetical protein